MGDDHTGLRAVGIEMQRKNAMTQRSPRKSKGEGAYEIEL
jgi:hypothetical protein